MIQRRIPGLIFGGLDDFAIYMAPSCNVASPKVHEIKKPSTSKAKIMGDKSPKATSKLSSQKNNKAAAADQKKKQAAAAKATPTKKK